MREWVNEEMDVDQGAKSLRRGAFGLPLSMHACMGWLIFLVLMAVYVTQAVWIFKGHPQPGWFSDSVFYLATADIYSGNVSEHARQYATDFFKTSRYPPLFPLSLSFFGGGLDSTQNAYCVVLGFGFLAVLGAFIWLKQEASCALTAALLIPIAALSPEFFFLNLEIQSETQFLALLVGVLILVNCYEKGQCALATLCAVASIVPLSRTAGIALLIALTVWLLVKQRQITLSVRLVALVGLWLPTALWMYYRSKLPIVLDYAADLREAVGQDTGMWLWALIKRLPGVVDGFAFWFSLGETRIAAAIAALVLIFAIVGWIVRMRRLRPDAIFLPIYLGLVMAWPYPLETARLLAVSMPVVALCAWGGARSLCRLACQPVFSDRCNWLAASVVLAATLAVSGPKWNDIRQRMSWQPDLELEQGMRNISYFTLPPNLAKKHTESIARITNLIQEMPNVVAPTDCVWTTFHTITAYLSDFRVQLRITPDDITLENVATRLKSCRYILISTLNSPYHSTPYLYPAEYLRFGKAVLYAENNFGGRSEMAAALIDLWN